MEDTEEAPLSTQLENVLRPSFRLARSAVRLLRVLAVLGLLLGLVETYSLDWDHMTKGDWLHVLRVPLRRALQAFVLWVLADALRVLFYVYDDVRAHLVLRQR